MHEQNQEPSRQANRGVVKVGVVVSVAMKDTATVKVVTPHRHARYHRIVRRTTRFMIHDPGNTCRPGDRVEIQECRPLSKRKRWRLIRTIHSAEAAKAKTTPEAAKAQQ